LEQRITEVEKAKASTGNSRGEKRRRRIFRALHDCVVNKGFAKTSLADVAEAAGMYPSHLLYYFDGKDAILEHYFLKVANQLVERIESFRDKSPEEQIDLLTKLYFGGEGITKSEIGFMLECFGVAVNDTALHRGKSKMDKRHKAYLAELFDKTPRGSITGAKDAAEVAYSILVGLRTAVYFDEQLTLSKARRLFRAAMLNIAGFDKSN